ncbi:hypothetical protein PENTCL1PPCAC_27724, partial [Pristionchus entomophagus]
AAVDSRKAAELDGKSVKAYYFWGRAALHLGQYEEAIKCLAKANDLAKGQKLIDEDLERARAQLLDESEEEEGKMDVEEGDRLLR